MTPERPDPVVPTATYRLQLQPAFPFGAAAAAVPYLASLGVSHLHLSPVLESVPGSTHGYDVVDHARVRDELGGEDGAARAGAHRAGARSRAWSLDIVPNHMADVPAPQPPPVGGAARGPRLAVRALVRHRLGGAAAGALLLPVLGQPLGEVWDELKVERGRTRTWVRRPRPALLRPCLPAARGHRGAAAAAARSTPSGTARRGGGWRAPSSTTGGSSASRS